MDNRNLFQLAAGFKNACRACTENVDSQDMVNLFDVDKSVICEIYTQCTLLQVSVSDGLPTSICQICHEKLLGFNSFRLSCIDADQFYRDKITIKHEQHEDEVFIAENLDETVKVESKNDKADKIKVAGGRRKSTRKPKSVIKFDKSILHDVKLEPEVIFDDSDKPEMSGNNSPNDENVEENAKDKSNEEEPRKVIYRCDLCVKKCFKKSCLEAHLRTHQGLKPFECKKCGHSFNKRSCLNQHLAYHNNLENNISFHCTYDKCERSFPKKGSLKSHVRTVHNKTNVGERLFTCETCGKSFTQRGSLNSHKLIHTGMPHKCDLCPKAFESNYRLNVHMKRHKGIKNFVCPECGLRKTTHTELQVHRRYHTGEKKFACNFCPKRFAARANMNLHERVVHYKIRSYTCQYCDQSFGKVGTLKHHVMTHTGEKPHGCDICGKRFIQVVALRAHLKTHRK